MNLLWKVLLIALFFVQIIGCSGASNSVAIDSCVTRGVEYFKEVGSYPTLHTYPNKGRMAEVVARERCKRTTTAF